MHTYVKMIFTRKSEEDPEPKNANIDLKIEPLKTCQVASSINIFYAKLFWKKLIIKKFAQLWGIKNVNLSIIKKEAWLLTYILNFLHNLSQLIKI